MHSDRPIRRRRVGRIKVRVRVRRPRALPALVWSAAFTFAGVAALCLMYEDRDPGPHPGAVLLNREADQYDKAAREARNAGDEGAAHRLQITANQKRIQGAKLNILDR